MKPLTRTDPGILARCYNFNPEEHTKAPREMRECDCCKDSGLIVLGATGPEIMTRYRAFINQPVVFFEKWDAEKLILSGIHFHVQEGYEVDIEGHSPDPDPDAYLGSKVMLRARMCDRTIRAWAWMSQLRLTARTAGTVAT